VASNWEAVAIKPPPNISPNKPVPNCRTMSLVTPQTTKVAPVASHCGTMDEGLRQ
jgi:hypothetical protein